MKNEKSTEIEALDIPDYIDQPEYVKNKAANYTLQTIGWICLMWLLFPLVSLVLWVFEGHLIYDYVWVNNISEVKTLLHLLLLIGLSALVLILWASYNWLRFHGDDRRSKAPNSSVELLASQFTVSTESLSELQKAQRVVLHYDDHGHLIKYDLK
ncbi:poly-beta-1,6-N-acetyl-D-glucosamine biosynthesis protein PgaD [Acinetobacter sp.]|jgi:poly-beta-1,6-N-acetyl-D-glucosamine biosynthesis protein PgaD|uniref:poly-beta-1,6-N-acetyl-D-glucosamine biosynthesis protein PgaD n=1 Tax=Acinetobacter sp. TaxID=472 RepID=UPI00281E1EAD|nr:poly-beta-1,6-N-acetyl-D-glucosamine biosynthesis protein PgaD [Acinetobacter sp.]MDR2250797.1 poly-beta-1,6-N-acetyl-D-glucosamine biosynthesis protein PgaD [Acinetobacter sp.]